MFEHFTLWEAVKIGGMVMYVLIACSVLSVAIIADRVFYFTKHSRVLRSAFMGSIRQELGKGDTKKATAIAKEAATPFSAVVLAGLNFSHLDEKEISEAIEREIIIEVSGLERRTAIVGTIGSTAVYIGLLGTVWGIMRTFRDISHAGSSGIDVVISGISEALVCTAAGLFVAIPAVMAYNYFIKRINGFVMDMELCASEIKGLIKGQKKVKPG